MADDLGRDALAHLAFGLGVDRQGKVGMGLDVDKAGGDREPLGIDHSRRTRRQKSSERRDPTVANGNVADLAGPPAAVDDEPPADQDVAAHGFRAACAFRSKLSSAA